MGISERLDTHEEEQRELLFSALAQTRVAIPGIIESFDAAKQTASVQPAVTENIQLGEDDAKPMKLPLLTDVPVYFPRANGYCITLPITGGDECLLVFADMCIDGWWQSGGVQGQMETRRHDLSDAIALVGITSQPRKVEAYDPDKLQIRTDDQNVIVEIDKDEQAVNVVTCKTITMNATESVTINAPTITLNGEQQITLNAPKLSMQTEETAGTGENISLVARNKVSIAAAHITADADEDIGLTAPSIAATAEDDMTFKGGKVDINPEG